MTGGLPRRRHGLCLLRTVRHDHSRAHVAVPPLPKTRGVLGTPYGTSLAMTIIIRVRESPLLGEVAQRAGRVAVFAEDPALFSSLFSLLYSLRKRCIHRPRVLLADGLTDFFDAELHLSGLEVELDDVADLDIVGRARGLAVDDRFAGVADLVGDSTPLDDTADF